MGTPSGSASWNCPCLHFASSFQPNFAFRPSRLRRKSRVPLDQRLKILFERIDILHFEAQMVHVARFDAGPFVIAYRPRRNHQGYSTVGEIMTGVIARFL